MYPRRSYISRTHVSMRRDGISHLSYIEEKTSEDVFTILTLQERSFNGHVAAAKIFVLLRLIGIERETDRVPRQPFS
jgi:hypothetical protein